VLANKPRHTFKHNGVSALLSDIVLGKRHLSIQNGGDRKAQVEIDPKRCFEGVCFWRSIVGGRTVGGGLSSQVDSSAIDLPALLPAGELFDRIEFEAAATMDRNVCLGLPLFPHAHGSRRQEAELDDLPEMFRSEE